MTAVQWIDGERLWKVTLLSSFINFTALFPTQSASLDIYDVHVRARTDVRSHEPHPESGIYCITPIPML
eukprot:scaffold17288_cov66-Phaeocystis_antarctica.AAC.1